MQKVNHYQELNLPEKQQGFLRMFLANISTMNIIEKIILFGSCARGMIHKDSDIDIFIITKREPTLSEEIFIMAECPPDYESSYYLPADIIIKPIDIFEKYKYEMGMVQKYVEMEGVDLTGLLQKRAG
jgi:predicted nucleotidyltransferase